MKNTLMAMTNNITIQHMSKLPSVPSSYQFKKWTRHTLGEKIKHANITLRIVNRQESEVLNKRYRHKDGPTNILSFVYTTKPVYGDIVLCAPLITQQAKMRGIPIDHHWAHLVVHGVLHLLGYDHQLKRDAAEMEKMEIAILKSLKVNNPYVIP